jgi:hypothetical protein
MLIRGKQFIIFWEKKTQQQWNIKNMQVSLDDVISVLFYIYKLPVLVICFVYKRIGNNRATYNAVLFKLCSMKYAVLILPHF